MDRSLFTTCRYTGKVRTLANESEFRVCFNCGGVTHKTAGSHRKTVYDLTVDNKVAETTEVIPETDLLKQEAFRCSYCSNPLADYSRLQSSIDLARHLKDSFVEGDDVGQVPVGSKNALQVSIDASVAFIETVDLATTMLSLGDQPITIEALINIHVDLMELATRAFFDSVYAAPDKTELTSLIGTAQTLHDAAVEGTDPGQYTVGSKATLQATILAATTVAEDETAIQSEVDTATDTLSEAVRTFEDGLVE